ncbi:folate family ECF transporter S component [Lacrimispora sp. 210928-DFI.3.58]|uniref:folate family ECF transporter S component n=1 Tax=Lacrimispora sp. 210928-DFI.3.58 TaxID=2883214 RepID=UPI0015B3FE70|nr:folate family ECF transporter S component [Lacrimispora sp. 210928-DFI.3.58]MCB7317345.1 folate family ECF transporter S component [Lacrimispora sp. 210928-DFI.3.58]
MKRLATLFTCSYNELKQVRTVTVCAMLGALAIVLGSFSIQVTETIRVGFSGIPNEMVHYLFGPVVGSLFAGALDILKYMLKPVGAFFPGLTLVTMLAGVIYGSIFYKKPITLARVLAAHFIVSLVCNVILNTWCLSILYGKGFLILLPPRIMKNLIMWPIDSLIFFNIAKLLETAGVFRILGKGRTAAS